MSDLHVKYLLVGGGVAASEAAKAIREIDREGDLLMIGQEINRPYHRPPLSKGFLRGPIGNGADIDARAALEHRERRDVGIRRPRRLDREIVHRRDDARDRIERRWVWNCEGRHLPFPSRLARQPPPRAWEQKVHPRRREITKDSSKNHNPPRSRSTERVAST